MPDLGGTGNAGKAARAALSAIGGVIPYVGGILSAGAAYWSEAEQEHANNVLKQWIEMLQDELREKGRTIAEVIARIDMGDKETAERIESPEYQSILKKAFRNWSSIDSESKREKIRNILSHAASSRLTTDDVVKLFIDWLGVYSDFHFEVIGEVYRNDGVSRGQIWKNLFKPQVSEDSSEADLYKLLIRDLSMGSVIRQHRQTTWQGEYVKKQSAHVPKGAGAKTMTSAFDNAEQYELTALGKQFVHYAMTEIVPRIEFAEPPPATEDGTSPTEAVGPD